MIKKQQAKTISKDARTRIQTLKRSLKSLVPRSRYVNIIKRVAEARSRAWLKARERHQKKMKFLIQKLGDCCKTHKDQKLWADVRAGRKIYIQQQQQQHPPDENTKENTNLDSSTSTPITPTTQATTTTTSFTNTKVTATTTTPSPSSVTAPSPTPTTPHLHNQPTHVPPLHTTTLPPSTNNKIHSPTQPGVGCAVDPLILGTSVTDKDLNLLFGDPTNEIAGQDVITFGEVTLDDDEKALLAKRPEFTVYEKLDWDRLCEEMNMALVKARWERQSRDWLEDETDPQTLEDLEKQDKLEDAEARLVYKAGSDTVDLGSRKVTDMLHNQRLHLPRPRPPGEEAVLGARLDVWKTVTRQYMLDNCTEGGAAKVHNLSNTERIGLKKLQKRIKEGEIIVLRSDKGNRFTVSSVDSFERQGDQHTTEDTKVNKQDLAQIQGRINCLGRGIAKVVGLGQHWGEKNEARCWANLATEAAIAPTLYPSPKTHKDLDGLGDPKTRPIVQARSCVTSRAGEIVADLLDAALLSFPEQLECKSTEEMLARVDDANEKVQKDGIDVCIGSGDVIGLYPNLKHKESSKMCADMIKNCPASFSNINYKAAGVFVAVQCTTLEIKESGLSTVVPGRRHKKGNFPGLVTDELNTRHGEDTVPTKFLPLRSDLTEEEKRRLLAKVVEVSVLAILRNHVYSWKGDTWLQSCGVPTGLRLSGIIGRVCMDSWSRQMRILMASNNMISFLHEKYVDDVEVVAENVPVGTRWNGVNLETTPETVAEDLETGKPRDQITMEAWGSMASSIIPGVDFTVEFASKSPNATVAMLDFQLWKEKIPNPENPGTTMETLRYKFYEKPMTNPKVLDSSSAMPHKVKVATLTQEGVRRLCNTSRELDTSQKCQILSQFMRKLQISGYNQRLRANILGGAVATFQKKVRAEQLGLQPVHRLGTHNLEERRLQKIMGKKEWFRPGGPSWKKRLQAKEKEILDKKTKPQGPPTTSCVVDQPDQTDPDTVQQQHGQGSRDLPVGGWARLGAPWPPGQGQQLYPQPPQATPTTSVVDQRGQTDPNTSQGVSPTKSVVDQQDQTDPNTTQQQQVLGVVDQQEQTDPNYTQQQQGQGTNLQGLGAGDLYLGGWARSRAPWPAGQGLQLLLQPPKDNQPDVLTQCSPQQTDQVKVSPPPPPPYLLAVV